MNLGQSHYASGVAKAYNVTNRFVRKAWQGKEPHRTELANLIRESPNALSGIPDKTQHDKKYHPKSD